jgi:dTDP-glucose 4,6-dehydratase
MSNLKLNGNYLVTGGAGFIGSYLCEELLERNCQVLCVDNLITGTEKNIEGFVKNPKFKFLKKDITENFDLAEKIDGIFHFASLASPVDYQKYPIETLRVGAVGTENILKLAVKNNCPILVASTSEVYGDPKEHPQKETYWGNVSSIGVRSCYDESKRYLEALTMAYHRQYQIKSRIVRIFNTYGPRMRAHDGRVVPNFCMQAIENKNITVYGNGTQTRSFCFVKDLVEGLFLLFQSDYVEPVNLGNPDEYTMLEFVKAISEVSKKELQVEFVELPKDDPRQRKPDITLAKKLFNWQPKTTLQEGLSKTYAYFLSQEQKPS